MMGFFIAGNGGIHTGSVLAVFGGLMLVSVVLMLWDFRDRDNGIRAPAGTTGDPR
jgi:hypothetical protein